MMKIKQNLYFSNYTENKTPLKNKSLTYYLKLFKTQITTIKNSVVSAKDVVQTLSFLTMGAYLK